ncbi:MAG: hypothetical protein U0Q15_15145 [Kineosporiaceae bacterium]
MAISTARRVRRAAAALSGAVLVLGLAACSDDGTGSASPAAGTTGAPAGTATASGTQAAGEIKSTCHEGGDREVTVPGKGGASTFAVGVGTGPRAVLLLHEAQQNHCRWMPFARALAARGGVQVWSVDSAASSKSLSMGENGSVDPSQDLVRMASYVRDHGATEVVLAGASMGGVGALVAGTPAGARKVAALSAPTEYNADAVAGARALRAPLLLMAGTEDADFLPAARTIAAAAKDAKVTLVPVPTAEHGTDMLPDGVPGQGGRPVAAILTAFLLG